MITKSILVSGEDLMKKTIERFRGELSAIRTGRASVALVENVKVESYGTVMPLNQLAGMATPDARTIEIRPWDASQLAAIEKAILKSELGLTPVNDGKLIRLSIPSMTEERRKEIIKAVGKIAEEFKVAVRNERRQKGDEIKKAEKDKAISEDDRKKAEADLQKLTDTYIHRIDELMAQKEKEVLEV